MTITHNIAKTAALGLLLPVLASAEGSVGVSLVVPDNLRLTHEETLSYEQTSIPVGILQGGQVPTKKVSGPVRKRSWTSKDNATTIDQFIETLLSQLDETSYNKLLDCHDVTCGSFDFRFQIDVLPAPYVYINLGNFRYVSLQFGAQYKTVLISKLANALWLQIIETAEETEISNAAFVAISAKPDNGVPMMTGQVSERLRENGHSVLPDLEYDSGSSNLGAGPFKSLRELAEYLLTNPEVSVFLVGHTDNVGSLAANITLSKDRAKAVIDRLVEKYGVNPSQMSWDGVGYLSPIASNNTEKGRELNRRVEVVIEKGPQ